MFELLNHRVAAVAGATLLVLVSTTPDARAADANEARLRPDEIARLSPYLQEAGKRGAAQLKKGGLLVEKGRDRIEDGNEQIEDGKSLVRKGDKNVGESRERYYALARAVGDADDPDEVADEAKRFKKIASDWEDALETIEDGQELIAKGNAAIKKGEGEMRDGDELIASGKKILRDVREASAEPSATAPPAQ